MAATAVRLRCFAAALAGSVVLAGCAGGGGEASPDAGPAASTTPPSAAPSTAGPTLPAGVRLTADGSTLTIGARATVTYQRRQSSQAYLTIRVDKLQKTSWAHSFEGWKQDAAVRKATPYFVRATVTNVGETDLGGRPVPLYLLDGRATLVEPSTFAARFEPCSPRRLPEAFPPGATARMCLVYLAPGSGSRKAVEFRPTQESVGITWTGPVEDLLRPKKPTKKKSAPSPSPS